MSRHWLSGILGMFRSVDEFRLSVGRPVDRAAEDESHERFVRDAYWIILGRAADRVNEANFVRLLDLGQLREQVLRTLISSTEFRALREELLADRLGPGSETALEHGLATVGDDVRFVESAYRALLGREADTEGCQTYLALLDAGGARVAVIKALVSSDEFAARYRELCPAGGVIPYDTQLCELANPAKWDNPDWLAVLRELRLPAERKLAMHRKAYEFTQAVWGLRRLGLLNERAAVLSVGAGHESLAYSLANLASRVIAVDLYDGVWQSACAAEGDLRVVTNPAEFAPFRYREDRLRFLQMNGCCLAFRDNSFDIAYSLSSIEHFGGWHGARRAIEEMARVVRPHGVVALATEWVLSGPSREEVFQPHEVHELIDVPGLDLVEPIDDRVWRRYSGSVVDLRRNRHETPHMVVRIDETTFTSVVVFLRKR